jgi:DNA (cytosine-5)-methyltransferase 1
MRVVSLFSGAGGMDLGFEKAGFDVVWANEYDKTIWETYRKNHSAFLETRSIKDVPEGDVPDCDGIIGGPPCQSWSLAGCMRGINDERGKLFYEYLRLLKAKKPRFFVAENVPGIKSSTHLPHFKKLKKLFEDCGYEIADYRVKASDYGVPQDRERIIVVGYRLEEGKVFRMPSPEPFEGLATLRAAIGDLPESVPAKPKNYANDPSDLKFSNQEHMTGKYSYNYMSRNRVRPWDEPSFTIIASGRHAPQHPDARPMKPIHKDVCEFQDGCEYRRLSVRECARIQTFPDDFVFYYTKLADAYKMIGNAVPVKLAQTIAEQIKEDLA